MRPGSGSRRLPAQQPVRWEPDSAVAPVAAAVEAERAAEVEEEVAEEAPEEEAEVEEVAETD